MAIAAPALLAMTASVLLVLSAGPALGHGGFHERLAQLAVALEKSPNDPALHFELADVNGQHGDWQMALLNLARVEELAPGKFPTSLLRGQAWLTGGQPGKAKTALDTLLAGQPEHARGRLLRARAAQRLGDAAGSLADYREALRRTPAPDPDLLQETAGALAAGGLPEEAVRVLAAGMEKLGPIPSLVLRAMEVEIATGNFDAALARVEALRKSAPRPEPWMARRASVLAQAGRIEESRVAWQALVTHLEALPNLERGSHAMSKLAEDARHALASLANLTPSATSNPAKP
ncbi:MAG: tetratricopeptide repeat protein [Verrucomicrobia bacterium]|nr:MAG: tetratricopeptide repeat protein [Verrucomicrobiota bacterium]